VRAVVVFCFVWMNDLNKGTCLATAGDELINSIQLLKRAQALDSWLAPTALNSHDLFESDWWTRRDWFEVVIVMVEIVDKSAVCGGVS
jgi:hypothetical protein